MPKRPAETEQRGFHGGFGVEHSSLWQKVERWHGSEDSRLA
jgi:hypothetical protein